MGYYKKSSKSQRLSTYRWRQANIAYQNLAERNRQYGYEARRNPYLWAEASYKYNYPIGPSMSSGNFYSK